MSDIIKESIKRVIAITAMMNNEDRRTDKSVIRRAWLEYTPKRLSGEWSNVKFRKEVMSTIQEPYGTATLGSSSTTYNSVFIEMRNNPVLAYTCKGLGRKNKNQG